MNTFTNTSARRTNSPPSVALPRALENSSVDRSPRIGQAQVLPITNARNHSGWRVATHSPIGPPQSCTIRVTSRRPSWARKPSTTRACSATVYRYPAGATDSPKPG